MAIEAELRSFITKEQFDKLEKLFLNAGFDVNIKWFRKRYEFEWEGIIVCLDYTQGYGHIIEFEKMAGEEDKDKALAMLKEKFSSLGIPITSRENSRINSMITSIIGAN